MRDRRIRACLVIASVVILWPTAAFAQSSLAGTVKDTSGAVLPGVTVEASSPALIEKSRSVATDESGQYRIVDLRPGVYVVTFTLSGFSTVVRDAVELPTNFTANVSVEMRVGGVEETLTVTGDVPLVDVQSALKQNVLNRELLDAIPVGRSYQSVAVTTPGVQTTRPDIGGSEAFFLSNLTAYGSGYSDQAIQLDGMNTTDGEGAGQIMGMYRDDGDNQELSFQTSAIPAEVSQGGVRINMIGKEGGNSFTGMAITSYAPGALQSNNFTDALRAQGLRSVNTTDRIYDYNATLGGPIRRDWMWFYASFRYWGLDTKVANTFYPDGRPAIDDRLHKNYSVRVTSKVNEKNKFMAYWAGLPGRDLNHRGVGGGVQPSASTHHHTPLAYSAQAKWTTTISNKMLYEAGFSTSYVHFQLLPQDDLTANAIARRDLILNVTSGAPTNGVFEGYNGRRSYSTSFTYADGGHAFKTGVQLGETGNRTTADTSFGQLVQEYRSGVPASVTVRNTPVDQRLGLRADLGIFVQDSWTLKRLTLSPGLRFEHFNVGIDEQVAAAGRFVPARNFAAVKDIPNWNNFAPRFGAAYDVFGDGKTAIKGSLSKYMVGESISFTTTYNPMVSSTDQRTWNDLNRDDVAQDIEIGPSTNRSFGIRSARNPDPDIKRPYHVEMSLSGQRQLGAGLSVSGGYFFRKYYRLFKQDNLLVAPSDYTPVQIANPLGGDPIRIYNLAPSKLGLVDILDTNSDTNTRRYRGVEGSFTARFGRRGSFFGGLTTGKNAATLCDVDDPNELRFCDQSLYLPYQTQFKLAGSYVLPWDLRASATFQSYPGNPTVASGSVTARDSAEAGLAVNYNVNRTIVPGLTQTQIIVPLITPGSKYLDRLNQFDLRFGKAVNFGRRKVEGTFDIYNLLNVSNVLRATETFGPALDQPLEILQGRLFKFVARFYF
jgi:hypothetical protein